MRIIFVTIISFISIFFSCSNYSDKTKAPENNLTVKDTAKVRVRTFQKKVRVRTFEKIDISKANIQAFLQSNKMCDFYNLRLYFRHDNLLIVENYNVLLENNNGSESPSRYIVIERNDSLLFENKTINKTIEKENIINPEKFKGHYLSMKKNGILSVRWIIKYLMIEDKLGYNYVFINPEDVYLLPEIIKNTYEKVNDSLYIEVL